MFLFIKKSIQNYKRFPLKGLEEFIDSTHNLQNATYGRSWRAEELRNKSTTDLQKLWFVLIKERNVLLSLRYDCQKRHVNVPHGERLGKVNKSMAVLKTIVHQRYLEKTKKDALNSKTNEQKESDIL